MILKDYTKAEIRILKSGTQLGCFRLVWSAILRCLAFCGPVNRAIRLTDSKSSGVEHAPGYQAWLPCACMSNVIMSMQWKVSKCDQAQLLSNTWQTLHLFSSDDLHWLTRSNDSTDSHTYCTARARTHTHTKSQSTPVDLTYPLWRVGVRQSQRPAGLRSSGERREFGEQKHAK